MKRNTIQKGLVLDAVNTLGVHPTADEIYAHISLNHPTISKGTVYRNLSSLCDDGNIVRVKIPNSSDRFDHMVKPHYHLSCEECKKVFDVDLKYMPDIISKVPNSMGFEINRYELVFLGLCKDCKQKQIKNK